MDITFARNAWDLSKLTYAYSWRFEETPEFVQLEDCVRNSHSKASSQGYDNISLLTREPLGPGTTITTRCAFEHYGAPLIVLADTLEADERGVLRFGDYIEVVLYEDGINVWRMWRRDGRVSWKKLMSHVFPVTAGDIHTLSVTVGSEQLQITADDRKMTLYIPDLYPRWHGGIDACEGVNRFYDLRIDSQ